MTNLNLNQRGSHSVDLSVMIDSTSLTGNAGDTIGILRMLVVQISRTKTMTKASTQLKTKQQASLTMRL